MLSEEALVSEEWTDVEIAAFTKRVARFLKIGLGDMEAEKLAEQMLNRDRPGSGDDRRLCLECAKFKKGQCTRVGFLALPTILQRCDGFSLKQSAQVTQ
jgi:hypothetical protein